LLEFLIFFSKDQTMSQVFCRKSSGFSLLLSFFAAAFLMAFCLVGCKRAESEKSSDTSGAPGKTAKSPSESATTSGKKLDTGRAVLEAMAAAYRSAKTYNDKGTVRLTAEAGDKKIDQKVDFAVAYQRPNKLRMEAYTVKIVIDGKKFYASIDDLPGQVLEKDAPAELAMKSVYCDRVLIDASFNGFAGAVPQIPLLLDDKAIDILLRDAEEPKLIEPGEIDGRQHYRVQIRRPDNLTVLWIDKETFVLRRMILPTNDLRRQMAKNLGGVQIETLSLVADFSGARLNGPIDQQAFQFEVPADAEIVKFFILPDPGQLLAKKVPDFKFVGLDGKPVTPQSLAGKIAVLDFWASWCEPCKINLPRLQQVHEKYKDNEKVVFLAVSIDGPQVGDKALEDLFKELKLTIPIYRDPEGAAVGFKFFGIGIPSSFIIDANGIVQDYEAGVNQDLVTVLPEKIDKLLSGENIFDAPLKRYQEVLKQYENVEEQAVPLAKISQRSEPRTFKLSPFWKCADLKSPGNILVLNSPNAQPRLLIIEGPKSIAEVGLDGKLTAVHKLNIGDGEFVTNIRAFAAADGKIYIAVFAGAQQRCHILDEQWNIVLSYPENALENPHSGIADVELGDLDGDGLPKLYVGYWSVVGVQAVTLDGKRLWSNRSIFNVVRMAVTEPDADGRRDLLCVNNNGTLVALDAKGQRKAEISVPNRPIGWIAGADLQGNGRLLWCGLSAVKMGETIALGLNLNGEELWNYALPEGLQPQPIEQIIPGKITRQEPLQWILPGPDGSINIIGADGKLIDTFNYGAMLQGLATVTIDGQPALIIASPNGLEAWKIE
jgi:thiol-disulfide isomerase/thioredoxin